MTLSGLERLSEIFNDMKHRAAFLRQLSFLFIYLESRNVEATLESHSFSHSVHFVAYFCLISI